MVLGTVYIGDHYAEMDANRRDASYRALQFPGSWALWGGGGVSYLVRLCDERIFRAVQGQSFT